MKQAAEGLAKIVVWKDGNTYNSRVALVPFSRAVKTGLLSTSILKGNKANKTLLTSTLDSIQATGKTAGQFGTPWAWYKPIAELEQRVPYRKRGESLLIAEPAQPQGQTASRKDCRSHDGR